MSKDTLSIKERFLSARALSYPKFNIIANKKGAAYTIYGVARSGIVPCIQYTAHDIDSRLEKVKKIREELEVEVRGSTVKILFATANSGEEVVDILGEVITQPDIVIRDSEGFIKLTPDCYPKYMMKHNGPNNRNDGVIECEADDGDNIIQGLVTSLMLMLDGRINVTYQKGYYYNRVVVSPKDMLTSTRLTGACIDRLNKIGVPEKYQLRFITSMFELFQYKEDLEFYDGE